MSVRFSTEADARFDAINDWWRENRDKAPDLFDREVEEAVGRLAATPMIGSSTRCHAVAKSGASC